MRVPAIMKVLGGWVLLILLGATTTAHAVCVSNAGQLQTAINAGEQQSVPYTIQLAQGTYVLAGGLHAVFGAPTTFEGGYNASCTARSVNPANTIIDLGAGDISMSQYDGSPRAVLAIDGVTLGHATSLFLTAGLYQNCFGCKDHPGEVRVTNSRITQVIGGFPGDFGQVGFDSTNGLTTIINTQFDHITEQSGDDHCEVSIWLNGDTTTTLEYITADLSGGKDFCLLNWDETGDHRVDIYNSIFWASDGTLGGIRGSKLAQYDNSEPIYVNLVNTLFRGYYGIGPSTSTGQQFPAPGAPLWTNPATFDYTLASSSALGTNVALNGGAKSVPKGNPLFDIASHPRTIGSAPDLGAYESPYNDAGVVTVVNASDCAGQGCGSLRDALNLATLSSSTAVTINFAIPLPCPAVISLGSPLPDVTKAITIDGYTQPGSSPNNDAAAFNATLCVVVQPASDAYYAFRVPAAAGTAASLTLSGVGLGDFSVPVELLGGSNHQITGNQFGGLINNQTYQLYGAAVAAVYMDAPGGQVTIGGSDPANRNVFLNATSFGGLPASAIQVGADVNGAAGACQIVGNTIGVQDDGTFAGRNTDYGIYVQGNACLLQGNRIAGVNKDAVFIDGSMGGGNNNIVRNNTVGLVPYGLDLSSSNGGAGVRVSGSHNVIGYPPLAGGVASFYANLIENMDGPGVAVLGNDSAGNTIRGNSIFNNGDAGFGISIDLSDDGATANDNADSDGGPNNLQNFPVVRALAWNAPPAPGDSNLGATVSGTLTTFIGPGFYQVDAYYSHGCGANGHGLTATWIGSTDYIYIPAQQFASSFSVSIVVPDFDPSAGTISVTATNVTDGEGSTSEASRCLSVDTIFKDSL